MLRIGSGKASCMSTCLQLLKRNDVNLNSIDNHVDSLAPSIHSRTLLMIAVESRHKEIVGLLLGKDNVNLNSPNGRGETPLWLAASREPGSC